ncbi:hypothetical protein HDV06_007173 [Boothiomyces sp. JEL0866]|nr:hypothetical protein HDV06_007173 [Boothiomyces sp. JEL0866]
MQESLETLCERKTDLDVWNKDCLGKPLVTLLPSSIKDIQQILKVEQPVAIACGRHSRYSAVNDSIVIDMKQMNSVEILGDKIKVGGGCTCLDVIRGLDDKVIPTGSRLQVGISGLCLGGGIGILSRQLGLLIDSLVSADIILANGELITTSQEKYPDLFWAIRGGGDKTAEIHYCWSGKLDDGEKQFIQIGGQPELEKLDYVDMLLGGKLDLRREFNSPDYYYEKSIMLHTLPNETIKQLRYFASTAPTTKSHVDIIRLGGNISKVKERESAFVHRESQYWVLVIGVIEKNRQDTVDWVQNIIKYLDEWRSGSYQTVGIQNDSSASNISFFGANILRLSMAKHKYDPKNIFRYNQNIPPIKFKNFE